MELLRHQGARGGAGGGVQEEAERIERAPFALATAADHVLVSLTVVDLTDAFADLFWVLFRPAHATNDPLFDANRSPDGASRLRSLLEEELARLGELAPPLADIVRPARTSGDEMFNWLMGSVRLPADDLARLAAQRVAIIGDAAHAMPIFAGEGGNHAMLDGVELGRLLADQREDPPAAVAAFYRDAHARWVTAIDGSEKRLAGLTRPIAEWRALARRAR